MKYAKRDLEKVRMSRKIVEFLREGSSLTAIAKNTKKGKGYVIKIRDLAITHGYLESSTEDPKLFIATPRPLPAYPGLLFPIIDGRSEKVPVSEQILEPKMEWIKERLELGWSPQTIFEEMNLPIARSTLYRALERKNLFTHPGMKNQMELIHAPGESLQVDWGKLFDVKDAGGKKKTIWIFIGVLGHSRFEMARVVERLDFKTTIEVLTSMLEELGGSPRKVTCDNPKVFTIKASNYEPELNQGFERFASHYGFTIEALPPSAPEKKGKVERMVPVKRRLFESYDISKYSLESAQAHITRKIAITNERRHGTHLQKPIDVFLNDEAAKLKVLPILPYEIESIISVTVRGDGYVRFDNKYYRVDKNLKKEIALVIGNSKLVSIYCRGRLLEVYERITDNFKSKDCK
jgi:transposase